VAATTARDALLARWVGPRLANVPAWVSILAVTAGFAVVARSAHELWPDRPAAPELGALGAAALPVVFASTLARFPRRSGDPIKAHYLLFLAPVSTVFALAAGFALHRRGGRARVILSAWLTAYSVSWVLTLATAF
jgi:hypothetical protein